ncbi:hypothetical protein HY04AAS1_0057 [Hydrogenobaculum sp. Y04AAS1]|uniref:hypothetical protein n=1 Tax=Hydrogenobaculum sp. (strain Y04AAS1) TaxID=380749 RepID=UPI00015BC6F8|nr:hypothetical protein HY04AAS1_0057 [Hydrogenobaculum sp. Y04AAS1]HCT67308.1 hypothetical protein [Hydrogenobaculum sp.]
MRFLIFILLFFSFSYGDAILKYETNFVGLSAGVVTVDIKSPQNIDCEGKTKGLFSIFYSYEFKFKKNGDSYFLEEITNGKKRIYTEEKIMKEKAWIPLFVSMLTNSHYELGNPIKVGNILIVPEENVQNEIYFFNVKNSNNVRKVIIWYDSSTHQNDFPKLIRIVTRKATIDLKRL